MNENIYFFEKVTPDHPDKLADRLGGKCVDMAYDIVRYPNNPRIAGECIIGHGECSIIIETDLPLFIEDEIRVNNVDLENDLTNIRKFLIKNAKDKEKVAELIVDILGDLDYYSAIEKLVGIIFKTAMESADEDVRTEGYYYYFTQSIILWLHIHAPSVKDVTIHIVKQDETLNKNASEWRVGDNGIFKGVPNNEAEELLTDFIYATWDDAKRTDGKGLISAQTDEEGKTTYTIQINQSYKKGTNPTYVTTSFAKLFSATSNRLRANGKTLIEKQFNPLGIWTGGLDVDTGACNRKLGSDIGRGATGGGLHFKDLSKGDVSINVFAHFLAVDYQHEVVAMTTIGDKDVEFHIGDKTIIHSFKDVVCFAAQIINAMGGFEKFAEWGLIRPEKASAHYAVGLAKSKEIEEEIDEDEDCEECRVDYGDDD